MHVIIIERGIMKSEIIPVENIVNKIYVFRGVKVMLDRDLAELYRVETRVLNQAVKRNISRFPADFMFQLDKDEFENWKSQIVMSNSDKKGLRHSPYVFTDYGILMLSSVLNSERAINVNIQIMRTFSKLRQMLSAHEDIKKKIESMEKKYDSQFKIVFDAIRELITEELKPEREIGFERKKSPE
jgi:hypothetical protein